MPVLAGKDAKSFSNSIGVAFTETDSSGWQHWNCQERREGLSQGTRVVLMEGIAGSATQIACCPMPSEHSRAQSMTATTDQIQAPAEATQNDEEFSCPTGKALCLLSEGEVLA